MPNVIKSKQKIRHWLRLLLQLLLFPTTSILWVHNTVSLQNSNENVLLKTCSPAWSNCISTFKNDFILLSTWMIFQQFFAICPLKCWLIRRNHTFRLDRMMLCAFNSNLSTFTILPSLMFWFCNVLVYVAGLTAACKSVSQRVPIVRFLEGKAYFSWTSCK